MLVLRVLESSLIFANPQLAISPPLENCLKQAIPQVGRMEGKLVLRATFWHYVHRRRGVVGGLGEFVIIFRLPHCLSSCRWSVAQKQRSIVGSFQSSPR